MTPLARYAQALSELTPDTVNHLEALLSEQAVFSDPASAPRLVAEINAVLDEKAPRFE